MIKSKLKLHGFNNLTKNFACSAYFINYADSTSQQLLYQKFVDQHFSADQLTQLLVNLCKIIGAEVLNIACQDYEPQGTSVTLLIADVSNTETNSNNSQTTAKTVLAHLDKSHVCVHTYPETHPTNGISTLRVDFEISTCGVISPLKSINFLIDSLAADIITLDYRIRGFTRDIKGEKLFIDHKVTSIQEFIDQKNHQRYEMLDINMAECNLFNTKIIRKKMNLENYLISTDLSSLKLEQQHAIKNLITQERKEIFYGQNFCGS